MRTTVLFFLGFLLAAVVLPHTVQAAYRSSSTNSGETAGNASAATVPSGVVSDDIVVCVVSVDDSGDSFTWPAGFTELYDVDNTTDGHSHGVAWKRLTAADSGSYTITHANGTGASFVTQCAAFSGRATGSNPTASSNFSNSANASPVSVNASAVTASAGDDVIWIGALDTSVSNPGTNFANPTDYTERQDTNYIWNSVSLATRDNVSAGSTGTVTGTATLTNGNAGWYAFLVRMPDAAPAPPSVSTVAASAVTRNAAVLNASITGTGGAAASTCGFAWGTVPTLSGGDTATTTDSTCPASTGAFLRALSALTPSATYYFRAYAINANGTGYGSILSFFTENQALIRPPNNLGLVGYWSFNEATSTVATDFSGRGNHASFAGGTANPSWTTGKRGAALDFDGINDTAQAGNASPLNITEELTVSLWFRHDGSSYKDYETIIGKGEGASYRVAFCGPFSGCAVEDGIAFVFDGPSGNSDLGTSFVPNHGQWYHFVGTYDGATSRVYINGVENATESRTGSIITAGTELTFGDNPGSTGRYFEGAMDEVRIYSRALGPAEVALLYGSGATRLLALSKELDNGSTLQNGLVGHWTFDGPDFVNTIADVSVTNNHAYLYGGLATSSVKAKGRLGQAVYLSDPTGGDDYIQAGGDIPSMNGSSFTLSAWVKRTEADTPMGLVSIGSSGGTGNEAVLALRGAGLGGSTCDIFGGLSLSNSGEILPGNGWHLVTCTYDASANTGVLYNNGVEVDSGGSGTDFTTTAGVIIGERHGAISDDYIGYIDDVRIYNRTLTPSEVKQLYNLGAATIAP